MLDEDIEYPPDNSKNVHFGNLPKQFQLLKGAVTIHVSEDVCIQEYLFHRFKEPSFADYVEGYNIYIADQNGIWIQLNIERVKKGSMESPFKKRKKKSKTCCLLSLFCCISNCKDEDTNPYHKKVDDMGYEADESDQDDDDFETFTPIDLNKENDDIHMIELVRDSGLGRNTNYLFLFSKFRDEF